MQVSGSRSLGVEDRKTVTSDEQNRIIPIRSAAYEKVVQGSTTCLNEVLIEFHVRHLVSRLDRHSFFQVLSHELVVIDRPAPELISYIP